MRSLRDRLHTDSLAGIETGHLEEFFVDWPHPLSPETHLRLLAGSDHIVLAIDREHGQVIGFVTALTDGVPSGSIPLLAVFSPTWITGSANH